MKHYAAWSSIAASIMMFPACSGHDAAGTAGQTAQQSGADVKDAHTGGASPANFTYFEIYEGSDGKTHFRDITVDLKPTNFAPGFPPVGIGGLQPVTQLLFAAPGAHSGRAEYEAGEPVGLELLILAPDPAFRNVAQG